jgi:hypothetical protein
LIVIGVYMVTPFLTAASQDVSAKVCVVAFSVAIPLLAALVLVNRQELFCCRVTKSVVVETARVVGNWAPSLGGGRLLAHHLDRRVGVLVSGLVAAAVVQSVGFWRLERDRLLERQQQPTPQEGEEPGGTEAQPPAWPLGATRSAAGGG